MADAKFVKVEHNDGIEILKIERELESTKAAPLIPLKGGRNAG